MFEENPEVLNSYKNLARFCRLQSKDYFKAEEFYKKLFDIKMRIQQNSNDKIELLKELIEFYGNEKNDSKRVEEYKDKLLTIRSENEP